MKKLLLTCMLILVAAISFTQERGRARDFGIAPGIMETGPWNAITDVDGVMVGHRTLVRGDSVRTGVTVIVPHGGNLFQEKVPAAVSVGNGFGKALGFTQVQELGNLETPIALTNTLNVFTAASALVDYSLSLPGNEQVRSVNPVAGETNDGWLNDIRGRHVSEADVLEALIRAQTGPVAEGNVGAGTGTLCLGFKGGIGTSSRKLPGSRGGYTVGVLVQTNFGGILTINGAPVGKELKNHYVAQGGGYRVDGSCMIIIATDAPLSDRNLERLAKRSFLALGRVGSFMSNGSGDYAIAFSTHPECRIPYRSDHQIRKSPELENDAMSPLFLAVVEATEEAIYNSLFVAEDMTGYKGRFKQALPLDRTLEILDRHGARQ
ncbi:MAG: P1 family peptidase [Bacteroidota bacterium]|nr:P1 family peptidase [Bacteroidota bacterium]